jgi:hypothetical protein
MDCYISKTTEEMCFAYLQSLEKEGFYDREKKKPAVRFADSFIKTRNLFQCAPIFSVAVAGGHDKIDLLDPPSYEISLGQLSNVQSFATHGEWGDSIGFGCSPAQLLKSTDFRELFQMKVWGRTGELLELLQHPRLRIVPHYEVPHGTYLDFEHCPVHLQPKQALFQFLHVRNLAPSSSAE